MLVFHESRGVGVLGLENVLLSDLEILLKALGNSGSQSC
jgi:hypothetical protein